MPGGLAVEQLHKRYGKLQAVAGVDLHVARGQMVGFLGPNGAGKTTTMRSILGMVQPDSGRILWDGSEVTDELRGRIGYMPQERGLYPKMRVHDQLVYLARLAKIEATEAARRADMWLERLGLSDRSNAAVSELSGGNQQRVQLAAALIHDPELLLLDEPFAGLDPVAVRDLRDTVAEQAAANKAVLFSSHQLDLVAQLCDEVVVIAHGTVLAAGAIDDLRASSDTRQLKLKWVDAVATGWTPPHGRVVETTNKDMVIEIKAHDDSSALIAAAAQVGELLQVHLEPPNLEEIFAELVVRAPSRVA